MTAEKRQTVVLVDDEESVLGAFRRLLGQWYDIRAFSSADALLAAQADLQPSLFLLDWMMPGVDGLALCRKLRQDRRFDLVPIAFLTVLAPDPKNVEEAYRGGAQSFIAKSYSPSFILVQIRALVDNHLRLRHLFRQRQVLLALVKHDVSNLLTGVITGLEVLAMHPVFRDPELGDQAATILRASSKLRDLFFDLTDILTGGEDESAPAAPAEADAILGALDVYTGLVERRMMREPAPGLTAAGDPRLLRRSLFYLVKFLDLHLPRDLPLSARARPDRGGVLFSVSVPGSHGAEIRRLMAEADEPLTPAARYDLLFLQYVRGALERHRAVLAVTEAGGETALSFRVRSASGSGPGGG